MSSDYLFYLIEMHKKIEREIVKEEFKKILEKKKEELKKRIGFDNVIDEILKID